MPARRRDPRFPPLPPGRTPRWRWTEGVVDVAAPHFVLAWPGGRWEPYRERSPIARLGRDDDTFVVQWLDAPRLAPHHLDEARADVRVELQFYLVDKDESDPWHHARFHCTTAANVYSCVRWSFVDPRARANGTDAPPDAPPTSAGVARRTLSIPVTCPRCETPTRLASTRHFECPACLWHD